MKVALCLFGNVGIRKNSGHRPLSSDVTKESEAASTNPEIAYESIKHHILDKYDTDVFIHSWSTKYEEKINNLYNPVSSIFEEQKMFDMNLEEYGINNGLMTSWDISKETLFSYQALMPHRKTLKEVRKNLEQLSFRTKSRWYSNCKTIELKREYEEKNNFKYDFVITTRLDCYFKNFINISTKLPDGFYASKRTGRIDEKMAFYDLFFMGDSETMDKFSTIYEHVHDYSIRPPFASRQHVNKFIGEDKIVFTLEHGKDYKKVM